jgi:hypothetical protein
VLEWCWGRMRLADCLCGVCLEMTASMCPFVVVSVYILLSIQEGGQGRATKHDLQAGLPAHQQGGTCAAWGYQ